jgi:hypothetical protein
VVKIILRGERMPRAPKKIKRAPSRPQKEIDWLKVDALLEAGCMGTEIAPHFDIHPDTLYLRTELEKGMTFTAYSTLKKNKGESILRFTQFQKAIGATDKGDNTLLIWLGKVRLEQREETAVTVAPEILKNYSQMMNQMNEWQALRQAKTEATTINKETLENE